MNKDITIVKYELFPKEEPTNIAIGFMIALQDETVLPYNTTFYIETIVSNNLNQQEAINQAWLQVKEQVEIRIQQLINEAANQNVIENALLGQSFVPPSDEEN